MSARLIDRFDPRPPRPAPRSSSWPITIGSAHIPGKPPRRILELPAPTKPPKKL